MSKRVKAPNLRLSLIVLLYLVMAVGYSLVVPIGRGADEWAHYWYAEFIADNGRLPADPAEREAAGYKSDWPPLYHLAAAAVTGWVETDGPPTFKYREDNVRRQLVPAQGPEAILHTEDELFPWQQEILVWHLGRFLSVVFSAGTLVVTYFIAVEVFEGSRVAGSRVADSRVAGSKVAGSRVAGSRVAGSKVAGSRVAGSKVAHNTSPAKYNTFYALHPVSPRTLALVSVAMLAFIPRFLFTGMLFNYDSLTLLLASLFLWLVIRMVKGYYLRWGFWILGALAGLAVVTKYLAILLPLEIVLVAWFLAKREPGNRGARFWILVGQAALAFLLVTGWWFGYLLANFSEIDGYGPVLGRLAPLIRGDASDRTVEQIFAWLSGGQAPPLDYIEKQSYTVWQLLTQFFNTFWGNPVVQPYPLGWFVWAMSVVALVAVIGLGLTWRREKPARVWIGLLLLHCALPLPFMLIRLFGARNALEAVQGRHILFLAGPAVAVLLVLGVSAVAARSSGWIASRSEQGRRVAEPQRADQKLYYVPPATLRAVRLTFYILLAVLLAGATGQFFFMRQSYPSLLPVRTSGPPLVSIEPLPVEMTLPGGATAVGYRITNEKEQSLRVSLIWQAGDSPAPEDYQLEMALVDSEGGARAGWRAYQTQAYFPTRAWEAGDTIRDEGWLPLAGLAPGIYEIRVRILGESGPVMDWQTLETYTVGQAVETEPQPLLWRSGQAAQRPTPLRERETAQLTFEMGSAQPELVGPDGGARQPVQAGPGWANFIIAPDWPAGEYYLSAKESPIVRVVHSERNFQIPDISHPLVANFEDKIKLLGYDLPARRVEAGSGLPLILYWQSLGWMGEEFVIFIRLLDNRQITWGGYDRLARENYSTLLWAPGEIISDGFAVPVRPDAPDGVYTLSLGWYREVDGEAQSLPILDPETGELTGETVVSIGPIKVGGAPEGVTVSEAEPQTELGVALGGKIELLGFDLKVQSDNHSETLLLTLYWQPRTLMETDYTVFVHVRDEDGETVAQKDSLPVGGVYPTSLWEPGEIIKDEISIRLGQLAAGRYELVVGMYDFATGERLAVGGSPDGAILLRSFEIN